MSDSRALLKSLAHSGVRRGAVDVLPVRHARPAAHLLALLAARRRAPAPLCAHQPLRARARGQLRTARRRLHAHVVPHRQPVADAAVGASARHRGRLFGSRTRHRHAAPPGAQDHGGLGAAAAAAQGHAVVGAVSLGRRHQVRRDQQGGALGARLPARGQDAHPGGLVRAAGRLPI